MARVIEAEVVYDPNEEAELLERVRLMREAKEKADLAAPADPDDDFSSALGGLFKNPPDVAGYRKVRTRLSTRKSSKSQDDLSRALVVGLAGALGAELQGGSLGAGIGAGLGSWLYDNLVVKGE